MKPQPSNRPIAEKLLDDERMLAKVSRDQSVYSLKPQALCLVEDEEDALRLVGLCRKEGVAFTPRGRGSGTEFIASGGMLIPGIPRRCQPPSRSH